MSVWHFMTLTSWNSSTTLSSHHVFVWDMYIFTGYPPCIPRSSTVAMLLWVIEELAAPAGEEDKSSPSLRLASMACNVERFGPAKWGAPSENTSWLYYSSLFHTTFKVWSCISSNWQHRQCWRFSGQLIYPTAMTCIGTSKYVCFS